MANGSRYEIRCQSIEQRDSIKSILELLRKGNKTSADIILKALQELKEDEVKEDEIITFSTFEMSKERDFIEDFEKPNGCYQCICTTCNNYFTGHKRRVACKKCATESK